VKRLHEVRQRKDDRRAAGLKLRRRFIEYQIRVSHYVRKARSMARNSITDS
jgi:hypothetical protein